MQNEYSMIPENEIIKKLQTIRENEDYTQGNIDFIQEYLRSDSENVILAAIEAAEGCIVDPQIFDILLALTEEYRSSEVLQAVYHSFSALMYEGVMEGFEDEEGVTSNLDQLEEWDDIQTGSIRDNYFHVKNILLTTLTDENEVLAEREAALSALSDLGFLKEIQEWIARFAGSSEQSSQIIAIMAMGKYPVVWLDALAGFLQVEQPPEIILEAISSSFSSNSPKLAVEIEKLLNMKNDEVISFALLTLANINQTDDLGSKLQVFTKHESSQVKEHARKAIELYTQNNFSDFMQSEYGIDDSPAN